MPSLLVPRGGDGAAGDGDFGLAIGGDAAAELAPAVLTVPLVMATKPLAE